MPERLTGLISFSELINRIDGFVWGWFLILLILGTGVYLSIRSKFVQVLHLGTALRGIFRFEKSKNGEVSSFGALCTALAATIGTGNIVGVATAISAGGPGALFWMIVAAFFGMATKYSEGLLAVKFRQNKGEGHYLGGPFYYIENGMGKNWKWLAKLFACFGVVAGLFGIGTFTQISGITTAAQRIFDDDDAPVLFRLGGGSNAVDITWSLVIAGALVTILSALVLIGGAKRIAKVGTVIVPFMAVSYVFFALIVVILNYSRIPDAISLIVKNAFDTDAAGGAIIGLTLKNTIQKGIGRGIFSNEAGLGSAPIASATAQTNEPVEQALITMTGTFFDTIIICSMTGLSIVVTGAWNPAVTGETLEGFNITAYAWKNGMYSLFGDSDLATVILSVCLVFFAFTTILGWSFYAERCLEYLTDSEKSMRWFRRIYIAAVAIGPYMTISQVWGIADIFNGLMAFPNLIALIALGGVVAKETEDYFHRKRHLLS